MLCGVIGVVGVIGVMSVLGVIGVGVRLVTDVCLVALRLRIHLDLRHCALEW